MKHALDEKLEAVPPSESPYYIRTFLHNRFYYDKPDSFMINIVDIAHALSNTCRFNGHVNPHYSVAQHSVLVSRQLPPKFQLAGLLHDAEEAYIPDIPSPLKAYLRQSTDAIDRLGKTIRDMILQHYGVNPTLPKEVHDVDSRIAQTEARDLHGGIFKNWAVEPYSFFIRAWPRDIAKAQFLHDFRALTDM